MALPAGRYGVTKNQLLKIKKLPMNTIKLIEELTEKFDLLGSAAFKNSTSVVTDSSDLVESGAVENIIGWGNKNLDNPASISPSGGVTVTRTATGYNVSNPSSAIWSLARLYYANEPNTDYTLSLDASVISGISGLAIGGTNNLNTTPSSYVVDISNFSGHVEKTFNVGDFTYICVTLSVSRGTAVVGNINFDNYMLEKGSTATAYEPYHASVDEQKADNSVIAPVEDQPACQKNGGYAVGEHFIRDGAFCTCTQPIAQGGTFTLNTNYTAGDVASVLTNKVTEVTTNNPNITLHATYRKAVRYGNVVQFKVRITLNSPLAGGSDVTLFNIGFVPVFNYIRAYVYEANTAETDLGNICSIATDGRITTKYALQASTYNVEGVVIV